MRTSLIEIKLIDDYLLNRMEKEESLLFEARLVLDPELQQKMLLQKEAYGLIHFHGRNILKSEIALVQRKLFSQPKYSSFRQQVYRIFFNKCI